MVKGKQDELFTFTEFTKKLMSITPNVYGNVFLKYLEPIHLQSYLQKHGYDKLNELQIQQASF